MRLEGQQLDHYQIISLIGNGGMGDVYLAADSRIGQQVAIKVIWTEQNFYPNSTDSVDSAQRLRREARTISQLDHPRILPLYNYGETQIGSAALVYLVMPYRPEGSLVDWIRQQYPAQLVPPKIVAHLIKQAAEALQVAHNHQIIHQDIKPSNFLVRMQADASQVPELLLADFGIAHMAASSISSSQNLRGTPIYMAPEQCQEKPVFASDQYALAVMTYELLTGRPPFQGNAVRLIYQHMSVTPEPPSTLRPQLPREIDVVLLRALQKRPEDRFASVTEFAEVFGQVAEHLETAATDVPPAPPVPQVQETPKLLLASPTPEISHDDKTYMSLSHAETSIVPSAVAQLTPPVQEISPEDQTYISPAQAETSIVPSPVAQLTPTVQANPADEKTYISSSQARISIPPLPEAQLAPTVQANPADEKTLVSLLLMAAPTPPASGISAPNAFMQGTQLNTPAVLPNITRTRSQDLNSFRWTLIAISVLLLLLLLVGGATYAYLGVFSTGKTAPPATTTASLTTITIIPASKDLKQTYTLSGVTGAPDANKRQVQVRYLSVDTQTSSKTVNATGQGTTAGTRAIGTLTFTNDTTLPQKGYSAGQTFTGKSGVTVVLEASTPATLLVGSSYPVQAQANVIGTVGNIPALDINTTTSGCSTVGVCVRVANNAAFTGGTNSSTYTVVQQSDIDGAANSLIAANQPNPLTVLQGQIQSNEQLVGTPQCQSKVSSDHQAGDKAAQLTVSVHFTCTGEVYDKQGAKALSSTLLTHQATTAPGTGYVLVGPIKTTVSNVTVDDQGVVIITTVAQGVWVYQFSQQRQQDLAKLVAGQSKQAAISLLQQQPGVSQVVIQLAGGIGRVLSGNLGQIRVVVRSVPGA